MNQLIIVMFLHINIPHRLSLSTCNNRILLICVSLCILQYYALQILETVIKTRWKILPRNQCEGNVYSCAYNSPDLKMLTVLLFQISFNTIATLKRVSLLSVQVSFCLNILHSALRQLFYRGNYSPCFAL